MANDNPVQLNVIDGRIIAGVSPRVRLTRLEHPNGAYIDVIDLEGTKRVQIYDGEKGDKGDPGDVNLTQLNAVKAIAEAAQDTADGAVRHDTAQTLSDANQATARANIGAAADADVDELKSTIANSDGSIVSGIKGVTGTELFLFSDKGYRKTGAAGTASQLIVGDGTIVSCKHPVTAGDIVTINAYGGSSVFRLYAFLDDEDKVISRSAENLSGMVCAIAPTGAASIVINNRTYYMPTGYFAYIGKPITELEDVFKYANEVTPIHLVRGYYLQPSNGKLVVSTPVVSSSGWSYGIVPCLPNDKFCVNGESYNGAYPLAWYFLDAEYNILISEAQNVTVNNKILNAPSGAAYFVVHTKAPTVLSYKGASTNTIVDNARLDLELYKQGKEPLELGGLNDTNGFVTTTQSNTRIRSVNMLSLDVYKYIALPDSAYNITYYAYTVSGDYLGMRSRSVSYISAEEVVDRYPEAKYIRFSINKLGALDEDISDKLIYFVYGISYVKHTSASNSAPELSASQKTAIKTLADDYYAINDRFKYLTSATINAYASDTTVYTNNKYKICCSLLAGLLWMGRSANDFPIIGGSAPYSNAVTKVFDFGYYFDFADRALYNLKPNDGYYGFVNQFNDPDYAGSYSWNSYYLSSSSAQYHQRMNEFLYANDMAKEMDRLGYTIPMSELQTGDLIFTAYPAFDPKEDAFDSIAYKHINHVAIVYEKTPTGLTVIESTPRFSDAIHISSSNGTDEEKVRIAYLLGTAVCFARHPAAWGDGGNVPSTITTR